MSLETEVKLLVQRPKTLNIKITMNPHPLTLNVGDDSLPPTELTNGHLKGYPFQTEIVGKISQDIVFFRLQYE
ncbi:MAG: hypothetical protein RML10_03875 [Geminocystis sp.]|nr:hypothetical protein [Geminocystis sp.]MDW8462728.1 hypothetical protein [Geminocystis sp.]